MSFTPTSLLKEIISWTCCFVPNLCRFLKGLQLVVLLLSERSPCLCCRIQSVCEVPCSYGDVCVHPAAVFGARDLMSYTWLEMWLQRGMVQCFFWDTLIRCTFQIAQVTWKLLQGKQLVKPLLVLVSSTCGVYLAFLLWWSSCNSENVHVYLSFWFCLLFSSPSCQSI